MTSTGAWQPWTTSRDTLNTKSAFVTYIRVRNLSIMSIVRSGRCLTSAGPQVCMLLSYIGFDSLRKPTGCDTTAATMRSGARSISFQMNGPPMQ